MHSLDSAACHLKRVTKVVTLILCSGSIKYQNIILKKNNNIILITLYFVTLPHCMSVTSRVTVFLPLQERLAAEDQRWLQEKEKDILAPLLIRLGNAETLSAEDAKQLHQDCLAEFKQRLVEHANLIQERYEKVSLMKCNMLPSSQFLLPSTL